MTRAGARVGVAFFLVMVGTTLPTPLYPLYEQRFGFGGLVVTVVFATYAVGVLAALLVAGRLSDDAGRRPVLLAGVACAALSSAVFLLDAVPALFAGRLLSGLSAGVFTGVATTTIVELAPPGRRARAGLLAAGVNTAGLGTGPVLAGALARFAPAPLVLPYAVHLGLVAVAAALVATLPHPARREGALRLRVQRLAVPAPVRGAFVRAATAGFAGFAVLGLFTAVSPLFVGQVLGVHDQLVVGAVAALLLFSATAGQLATAALPERVCLLGGCLGLLAGTVLIGAAVAVASLPTLLAGAVVAGVGIGASFRSGLTSVTAETAPELRSAVTSSFFLVLYLAISGPVIGVGAAAAVVGLVPAAVAFTGVVAALALAAFLSLVRRRGAVTSPG